jgi:hypothetical protein
MRYRLQLHRLRPSPALVVAMVAVIVASAGSATAARLITGKQIRNGSISTADLTRSTRAKLAGPAFIKVAADGSTISSRNVGVVTRNGPGDFNIAYKRNVEKCAILATPRGTADNQFHGYVTTYTPGGTTVRVVLRDALGVPSDGAGFSLAVVC